MTCERCGGTIERYTLEGKTALVCADCGFLDVAVEHRTAHGPRESWSDALNRFYEDQGEPPGTRYPVRPLAPSVGERDEDDAADADDGDDQAPVTGDQPPAGENEDLAPDDEEENEDHRPDDATAIQPFDRDLLGFIVTVRDGRDEPTLSANGTSN